MNVVLRKKWSVCHFHFKICFNLLFVSNCLQTNESDNDGCFLCSVEVRSLSVQLSDGALSSDLFPDAYGSVRLETGDVCDDVSMPDAAPDQLPARWMAVELLESVLDHSTTAAEYEPATDVVRTSNLTLIFAKKVMWRRTFITVRGSDGCIVFSCVLC